MTTPVATQSVFTAKLPEIGFLQAPYGAVDKNEGLVVFAAATAPTGHDEFIVGVRFDRTMKRDESFGTNGRVMMSMTEHWTDDVMVGSQGGKLNLRLTNVHTTARNELLLVGSYGPGGSMIRERDGFFVKLNEHGHLDHRFGAKGIARYDQDRGDILTDSLLNKNGTLLFIGKSSLSINAAPTLHIFDAFEINNFVGKFIKRNQDKKKTLSEASHKDFGKDEKTLKEQRAKLRFMNEVIRSKEKTTKNAPFLNEFKIYCERPDVTPRECLSKLAEYQKKFGTGVQQ